MNTKDGLEKAKAAWAASQTPETAEALTEALFAAYRRGDITYDEAVDAGIRGLIDSGLSEAATAHVEAMVRSGVRASAETLLGTAKWLAEHSIKPDDLDSLKAFNDSMAASLPPGLDDLWRKISSILPAAPAEVVASVAYELYGKGVRADDIEDGGEVGKAGGLSLGTINLKRGWNESKDSVGPTVGNA